MKLLFESWRKFITEDEQEEFDPGFDQTIKDCDECGNGLIGTECDSPYYSSGCLEKKGFKKMGEGSFRNVYALPGNAGEQYVLKVAAGDDITQSKKMNAAEADTNMQRKFGELLPKTYKHANDYSWVVVERVHPWEGSNDQFIQAFFPAFANLKPREDISPVYARTLWQIFESFTNFSIEMIKEGDAGKDAPVNALFVPDLEEGPSTMPKKKQREIREKGYPARIAFEKTLGPLYKRFADLAAEYNVEPFDIVSRNVGTRADDSFVILDLSVFPEGSS
jgi:hypothetical protein